MQLSVKGKQLDVGDALRTHVDESLSRILDKYFGDALEVTVTLSRDAHLYRAVISAHVGRGIQLEAHGEANEPYPAFDGAADRLSKRLRRYKRRLRLRNRMVTADRYGADFDFAYLFISKAFGSAIGFTFIPDQGQLLQVSIQSWIKIGLIMSEIGITVSLNIRTDGKKVNPTVLLQLLFLLVLNVLSRELVPGRGNQ